MSNEGLEQSSLPSSTRVRPHSHDSSSAALHCPPLAAGDLLS
jgi:hypothetical protein